MRLIETDKVTLPAGRRRRNGISRKENLDRYAINGWTDSNPEKYNSRIDWQFKKDKSIPEIDGYYRFVENLFQYSKLTPDGERQRFLSLSEPQFRCVGYIETQIGEITMYNNYVILGILSIEKKYLLSILYISLFII